MNGSDRNGSLAGSDAAGCCPEIATKTLTLQPRQLVLWSLSGTSSSSARCRRIPLASFLSTKGAGKCTDRFSETIAVKTAASLADRARRSRTTRACGLRETGTERDGEGSTACAAPSTSANDEAQQQSAYEPVEKAEKGDAPTPSHLSRLPPPPWATCPPPARRSPHPCPSSHP